MVVYIATFTGFCEMTRVDRAAIPLATMGISPSFQLPSYGIYKRGKFSGDFLHLLTRVICDTCTELTFIDCGPGDDTVIRA